MQPKNYVNPFPAIDFRVHSSSQRFFRRASGDSKPLKYLQSQSDLIDNPERFAESANVNIERTTAIQWLSLHIICFNFIATPPKKKTYHLMVDFHGKCKGKYTILWVRSPQILKLQPSFSSSSAAKMSSHQRCPVANWRADRFSPHGTGGVVPAQTWRA